MWQMTNRRSLQDFSNRFDAPLSMPSDSTLLELRSCYREMPGTILTLAQACRLTAAPESRVRAAINALIEEGFLRSVGPERYGRAD